MDFFISPNDFSATPSFPSQPEGKIGLPRANPRGSLRSPSYRFLFNASSCIKKREKNQQGPCRSQPWTPWRSFSEQSCLICQCTVTGDLELEFGGKQWHELNCDVKLNVRPIFAVTLSPNWGLPRAFSVGGRRKAVRDRLALQGGTGDFP